MNRKIRYSIIGLGLLVFVLLAPLIILYVRGTTYDFATKKFVSTGILIVRSEPKTTGVYLDGKLKQQASGELKYILPGEYEVSLQKSGYNDWSKRLSVQAGQVTWAGTQNGKIYLFLNSKQEKTIAENVLDFSSKNNLSAFLTANALVTSNNNSFSQATSFVLPKPADQILNAVSNNFLLVNSSTTSVLLFNSSGHFTDLSSLFSTRTQWQMAENGELYALNQGVVYKINPDLKIKSAIFEKVKTFYVLDSSIYAVLSDTTGLNLVVSSSPLVQPQKLIAGMPDFQNGELLVTSDKRIFLLADSVLYQAGGKMEKVADNVSDFHFDSQTGNLEIFHAGEFDYFSNGLNFITRSAEPLTNLVVNHSLGYGFNRSSQGITAIELDTRDRQNQYLLYKSASVEKFFLDEAGENILLLDAGVLKSLKIR